MRNALELDPGKFVSKFSRKRLARTTRRRNKQIFDFKLVDL